MSGKLISILDVKRSLRNDLSVLFSANEAFSISRIILEHFGFSEIAIVKKPSLLVPSKIQSEIKKIVFELSKNKPIQYILGETFFYDLRFFVNENVLIPRPETEELVSKILLETNISEPSILDIGCGSGCIAISLASNIPGSKVYAMDIDNSVIQLAKKNSSLNNTNIKFFYQSIFDIGPEEHDYHFDIIVSNPPYVTSGDKLHMESNVLDYEPELALFTPENDPLIFYKAIIAYADRRLSKNGAVWVEINERFGPDTQLLFKKAAYNNVRLLKDIHGKNRFIKACK